MDPYVELPEYVPPGQVYSGPPRGTDGADGAWKADVFRELERLRTEQAKATQRFNQSQTTMEEIDKKFEDFATQAYNERLAINAEQEQLRKDLYTSGATPVPPNEQLTAIERDQLDFFQKSPGIGMIFLTVAFALSRTDLGGELPTMVLSRISSVQEETENLDPDENTENNRNHDQENPQKQQLGSPQAQKQQAAGSFLSRSIKGAKIVLTILMPLILLSVQFAYVFFIFYEAFAAYMRLDSFGYDKLCPGYDVPANTRADPPFGADEQVRVLVAFIGAFYVFRNISQLITFQRALLGNVAINEATATPAEAQSSPEIKVQTLATFAYQTGTQSKDVIMKTLDMKEAASTQPDAEKADTSMWSVQDISESRIYFIFCTDIFLNLAIVFLVLMCNLYIVFVAGGGAQDCLTKVVILNFILDQQPMFKREIFVGTTGRVVLAALRQGYEWGAPKPKPAPTSTSAVVHRSAMIALSKEIQLRSSANKDPAKGPEYVSNNMDKVYAQQTYSIMDYYAKHAGQGTSFPKDFLSALPKFKADVQALKTTITDYEGELRDFKKKASDANKSWKSVFAGLLLILGQIPIFLSVAYVLFAPVCKPGLSNVVVLGRTQQPNSPTIVFRN